MEKAHLILEIDQDKKVEQTSPQQNYGTRVTDFFKSIVTYIKNRRNRPQNKNTNQSEEVLLYRFISTFWTS